MDKLPQMLLCAIPDIPDENLFSLFHTPDDRIPDGRDIAARQIASLPYVPEMYPEK
ncbi:MAG: hypothetical protein K6G15_12030 [Desulfovibrio sp.]|nr:hypothetical protein [Desulfovibrio sp.]